MITVSTFRFHNNSWHAKEVVLYYELL